MCINCEIRLDPYMTKEEIEPFLKAGCPLCNHFDCWRLVEGKLLKE